MVSITCSNVKKSYGSVDVIEDLNLVIPDKEFVVFLGPSGCGKSTMLRMIAGLESISGGEIRIGDRVVNDVAPGDRDVAMVFQSYALYPHMTVYDNIAFGLRRRKVAASEIKARIDRLAKLLQLEPYLDRKPKNLSGGQQQRVAMARAMIKTPQVFLFDEPLSNLDAKLREHLRVEIKKLHLDLRTTTIFVTHDQLEALTLADRIVLMRAGRIEQVGTPAEIYRRPASRFVADFIGTPAMNFLDLEASRENEQIRLRGDGLDLAVPAKDFAMPTQGQTVEVGLRPSLMERSGHNDGNAITGKLVLIENMGAESQLFARVGSREIAFTTQNSEGLMIGDDVSFAIKPEDIHVFDKQSGESLRTGYAR